MPSKKPKPRGRPEEPQFLAKKEDGRRGWDSPDWMDGCREQLAAHIVRGDPLDVALFAAFLHYHGERTNAAVPQEACRD